MNVKDLIFFVIISFSTLLRGSQPPVKSVYPPLEKVAQDTTAFDFATEVLAYQHKSLARRELIDADDWTSSLGTIIMFNELLVQLAKVPNDPADAKEAANTRKEDIEKRLQKISKELAEKITKSMEEIVKIIDNRGNQLYQTKPDYFRKISLHSTDVAGNYNPLLPHKRNRMEYIYEELAKLYQNALHCTALITVFNQIQTHDNDANNDIDLTIKNLESSISRVKERINFYVMDNKKYEKNTTFINKILLDFADQYKDRALILLDTVQTIIQAAWEDKNPAFLWDSLTYVAKGAISIETRTSSRTFCVDLEKKYQELQRQKIDSDNKKKQAEAKQQELEKTIADIIGEKKGDIVTHLKDLLAERDRLKTQQAKTIPIFKQYQIDKENLKSCQKSQEELDKTIETVSKQADLVPNLKQQIASLKTELKQSKMTLESSQTQLATAQKEIERLQKSTKFSKDIEQLTNELISYEKQIETLNAKIENQKEDIETLSTLEAIKRGDIKSMLVNTTGQKTVIDEIFNNDDAKKVLYKKILNILKGIKLIALQRVDMPRKDLKDLEVGGSKVAKDKLKKAITNKYGSNIDSNAFETFFFTLMKDLSGKTIMDLFKDPEFQDALTEKK